jgi:non-ribosomal peptide synthetase component E (peptide arylation enzyme)
MILGKSDGVAGEHGATLDELFRRAGVRHPQATALIDPPNRESFTDGAPRVLSYAEADWLISAFAARLRDLGLRTDAVVAIQLPNSVEGVIALLGVLRAGMIAAFLPLLWRQQDIVDALRGTGAKAIVTCARAGTHAPAKSAMLAAAELFPIRHICGFGRELPDGVMPLDDLYAQTSIDLVHGAARPGAADAHVAVLTFDVTAEGVVPAARNHRQLIGGGLAPFLEADLAQDAAVLSTIPPASFAGLALGVLPWLLCGGTLALHQGCDPKVLATQCGALAEAAVILPGPAVAPLGDAGLLNASIKCVVALWRAPERLASCAPWHGKAALVDVAAFGEIGLLASRRGEGGMPAPIPCGPIGAPRGAAGAVTVAETARRKTGTLMLRGPMVPAQAFPPGAEQGNELAPDPAGFVDTGFACRRDGDALTVTGPPPGIAAVGGYRFRRPALEAQVAGVDPAATIVAVPDGTIGERLAGGAADPQAAVAALQARGANPLISGAFRPRGEADAA